MTEKFPFANNECPFEKGVTFLPSIDTFCAWHFARKRLLRKIPIIMVLKTQTILLKLLSSNLPLFKCWSFCSVLWCLLSHYQDNVSWLICKFNFNQWPTFPFERAISNDLGGGSISKRSFQSKSPSCADILINQLNLLISNQSISIYTSINLDAR